MSEPKGHSVPSLKPVILLVVVISVALGAYTRWRGNKAVNQIPRSSGLRESNAEQEANDIKTLESTSSNDILIRSALQRLCFRQKPAGLEFALKQVKSEDAQKKIQASSCLGQFEDPRALSELKSLLSDADPKVRTQAIYHLSTKRNSERQKILEEAYQATKEPDDKTAILVARWRIESVGPARENLAEELKRQFSQKLSNNIKAQILRILANVPTHQKFAQTEVAKIIEAKTSDENNTLKVEAIRSLKIICPQNRVDLLLKAAAENEKPEIRQSAFMEFSFHSNPRLQQYVAEQTKKNGPILNLANGGHIDLRPFSSDRANGRPDYCEQQQKRAQNRTQSGPITPPNVMRKMPPGMVSRQMSPLSPTRPMQPGARPMPLGMRPQRQMPPNGQHLAPAAPAAPTGH